MVIKPWMVIIAGVTLTVCAALISQYLLEGLQAEIAARRQQEGLKEKLIEETWLNNLSLENKKNTAYLLMERKEGEGILQCISGWAKGRPQEEREALLKNPTPEALIASLERAQQRGLDKINDVYAQKIILEQEISALEMRAERTGNIAVFLQVMGLILVASKDLVRRS